MAKQISVVQRGYDNGYSTRTVSRYTDGTIVVVFNTRGESWARYVAVSRKHLIARIRSLRKAGRSYNSIESCDLIPDVFHLAHYRGPGQSFARDPYRFKANRKYVIYFQSGGLDI